MTTTTFNELTVPAATVEAKPGFFSRLLQHMIAARQAEVNRRLALYRSYDQLATFE